MTAPVIFLVFNRPALTKRVFERIRTARPPQLFVVADGPRIDRIGEAEKCAEVRRLIEEGIDWPCELVRDYSEINLGCGKRVSSGITNAFRRVEEAIILEDDCLPDPSFFRFCEELLMRYRNDPMIGMISGSHHQTELRYGKDSYYFCRYGNIWGWATWRRAWQYFDYEMTEWRDWKGGSRLHHLLPKREVREFWRAIWDETFEGKHDSWDYQWTFCYMQRGLLGVLPQIALIENIGFGKDATHTVGSEKLGPEAGVMPFPLVHPSGIKPDYEAEARASARFFSRPTLVKRLVNKLGRIVGRFSAELRR